MVTFLEELSPVVQVLLATAVTWGLTALSAALVFLARQLSRRPLGALLGFAAGAMIFVVV
ncbi:MAG: hypothetical protein AVDCRST_MAG19-4516 [uncultured Thermomicrobiales bacterium]|uniref:ZIP family metal transporter n=1 Tax=uncultured Thermomicrobiales bacterium TaxID=1645740 RepID=A0A6J4VWT7_9BACT|nr:MAG: hypothetical protein AVDCRST_MAG19-4516 [uncultured Thermomicrobiales bacterium]